MARQTKAQRLQAAFEAGRTGQNRDGSAIDPCYPDYLATHAERVAFWRGVAQADAQYEAEQKGVTA